MWRKKNRSYIQQLPRFGSIVWFWLFYGLQWLLKLILSWAKRIYEKKQDSEINVHPDDGMSEEFMLEVDKSSN